MSDQNTKTTLVFDPAEGVEFDPKVEAENQKLRGPTVQMTDAEIWESLIPPFQD